MSDSDDDPDYTDAAQNEIRYKTKIFYEEKYPYIRLQTPDFIFERWNRVATTLKKKAGHMMQVSVFWWHILLRQNEGHTTTDWAVEMGFLDSNVSNDLSLKRLHQVEILECILRAMERACYSDELSRKLVKISVSFSKKEDHCMRKAKRWLEQTGEPNIMRRVEELRGACYQTLEFIFSEYARYVETMAYDRTKIMIELSFESLPWCIVKSEEMKSKGNDQFQRKKYHAALKWYTKAIRYHPENHILYGNRALCFIRCEKYQKAIGDGKRATVLQPDWAKGHYRFCDALFFLGEHQRALEANETAQSLCRADPEGFRDLQQQCVRFRTDVEEEKGGGKLKKPEPKKAPSKRPDGACGTDSNTTLHTTDPGSRSDKMNDSIASENKSTNKMDAQEQSKNQPDPGGASQTDENSKVPKEMKSEMAERKTRKAEPCTPEKQKVRSRPSPSLEKTLPNITVGSRKEQLKSAVQDAHTALSDQRCRNAEQAFAQALSIVDSSEPKELGISEYDKVILRYGYATSLLEIGQPEELAEAESQFAKIKSTERQFQSLVHFGVGKVFLKENRFSKALEQFSDAQLMVKRQIIPGKLTWPTTKVTVDETQPEYLKVLLEKTIEMCKFPPKPDAICRHHNCLGHSKIEIYFTDPDFKGFIRMMCCQSCHVEFHISCWKKLKAVSFTDKNEKDLLQEACFTPDCGGRICHIVIFGSTGLIKCEFESSIAKSTAPVKLRVKQKCTSLKKFQSKEDRKLRRKQHRQAASLAKQERSDQILPEKSENSMVEPEERASSRAWLAYGDRVLHQIGESKELFKDETVNISPLTTCLKPWMEMDRANRPTHPEYDGREPQMLKDVVDLLLERKNRVWARLFIQILSSCLDTNPKLRDWAQQLDNAGLKAAETFIDRYAEHLEVLDLASLLTFPPMQDVLIEKFGTMPEFFSSSSCTVTDYLKQAPPQEMRLFIWTLEENRDCYPSCLDILDEYFEMDSICLVIKKTDNESQINSPIKSKSRNRKKKQKEPKSVIVLSGMRSGALREEDDEDVFSEDDSLMLLSPIDPFSVPDHLRDQVAEFEGQYASTGHSSHYKRTLDNHPDPTKESLYDYFAQILEEHGPLEADDQLLVGMLDSFPPEAQQKIEEAGGLQPFLLESLRFVMTDHLIGLMKHTVSLQNITEEEMLELSNLSLGCDLDDFDRRRLSHLNPSAKEFLPHFENTSPRDTNGSFGSGDQEMSSPLLQQLYSDNVTGLALMPGSASAFPEPCPTLPNPYVFGSQTSLYLPCAFGATDSGAPGAEALERSSMLYDTAGAACSASVFNSTAKDTDDPAGKTEGIDPHNREGEGELPQTAITKQAKAPMSKTVAVQAFRKARDDVAVNTEPYEAFERNKGDMTEKEKSNMAFENQIKQMKEDYETVQQKRKDDVSMRENELEEMRQKIEITNKELGLFQQKLEEEVRKDQQEKKENQETLKALKAEIKELAESHESLSKDIREKNKEYETQLDNFLEISNQSAAEKMSLEDELQRCRDVCAKAARRSQAAELSILQNRRGRGLRGLYKCASDGKAILTNMTEVSVRYPSAGLHPAVEAWGVCVHDADDKIVKTEAQYEEQMEQVRKGTRLSALPQVFVPSAPPPPPVPIQFGENGSLLVRAVPGVDTSLGLGQPVPPLVSPVFIQGSGRQAGQMQGLPLPCRVPLGRDQALYQPLSAHLPVPRHPQPYLPYRAQLPARPPAHQGGNLLQQPVRAAQTQAAASAASGPNEAPLRPAEPQTAQGPRALAQQQHVSIFEKIVDRLSIMFPHYSRPVLTKFIQEVRSTNGDCLSSLSYEEVINRVAQLILDHQENTREQMNSLSGDPSGLGAQVPFCQTPPPRSDSPASSRSSGTPPPSHVWKNMSAQNRSTSKALNMEDPCVICHEDMTQDEFCVLECRHSFHRQCIKSWLREQRTCPTCRKYALLPEDFPMLPDRLRRGHASAAAPSS